MLHVFLSKNAFLSGYFSRSIAGSKNQRAICFGIQESRGSRRVEAKYDSDVGEFKKLPPRYEALLSFNREAVTVLQGVYTKTLRNGMPSSFHFGSMRMRSIFLTM